MGKYLPLLALIFLLAPAGLLSAQEPAPHGVGGEPDLEAAQPRRQLPPVVYSTPKPEPSPSRSEGRAPDYNDFEQLHYQKEMWEQYQRENHQPQRPQPRPRPRPKG